MEYPNDFDTPAFPAGKQIAVSRFMAIWTMVMLLIALCLGGMIIWATKSQRMLPFMISTSDEMGKWEIVGDNPTVLNQSIYRTMQESLITNFLDNWFNISKNMDDNISRWKKCERSSCTTDDSLALRYSECSIFCNSGDGLYYAFARETLPDIEARAFHGETWQLQTQDMKIKPISAVTEFGGLWEIDAHIKSNINGTFMVKAFVKVSKGAYYPGNLGFFVDEISTYRMP